jgi:predicted AlkP superfamily phosphohydrolase/phosphomutase
LTPAPAERVACLGFDSAGISFLQAGIEAGRLPTLTGLLESGRSVALADCQEIATSAAWATLIRGCDLPDHGLFNDRALAPGEYRMADVYPESAARPPFWRYLSDAGIRSVLLSAYGAPLLDPFEGIQVAGWGSHDPFDAKLKRLRSDPPGLIPELARLVGPRAIRYDGTPPRGVRGVRAYVEDMVRGCGQQAQAFNRLLEMGDWRFALVSFAECHQAGHWLWHLADAAHPDHDPDVAPDLRDGLMRVYEATDRAIGTILSRLPERTAVLVVSPYDMGPNHHLDEALPLVLERGGWLVRPPAARAGARVRALRAGRRAVRAVVPLALRPALGRLIGRDRLLAELAAGAIDWQATTVLPLPSDGSAALRLNLAGREPTGTVEPGPDAERTLEEITACLEELRCADTGRAVVARVARYEELFDAAPLSGVADLFVQWERVPRPRALRSERVGEIPVPVERSIRSVHHAPGFAVAAGPGIAPAGGGRLTGAGQARLADVAATVLALLGVPAPPEVTGRPIPGLVPAAAEAGA